MSPSPEVLVYFKPIVPQETAPGPENQSALLKAMKVVWKELAPKVRFPDSFCIAPHHTPLLPGTVLNLEHNTLDFYTGAPLNQSHLRKLLDPTFQCVFPRFCQSESCQF